MAYQGLPFLLPMRLNIAGGGVLFPPDGPHAPIVELPTLLNLKTQTLLFGIHWTLWVVVFAVRTPLTPTRNQEF